MPNQYLSEVEVRRSYHSGLSGTVLPERRTFKALDRLSSDKVVRFWTAKYLAPDFHVALRSSVDWHNDFEGTYDPNRGVWEFSLPPEQYSGEFTMKLVLRHTSSAFGSDLFWMDGGDVRVFADQSETNLNDDNVVFGYQVQLETNRWRPNHLVTLRNQVDGWGRNVFGSYRDGRWNFLLDLAYYPTKVDAKFMLDNTDFMAGDNLEITTAKYFYLIKEEDVSFPQDRSAYQHGYDNFVSLENREEQLLLRSAGRESEHFDVIIIGSGMGGGALADAVSDNGAKVLLLDAGGLRFPVHMNELPRSSINFVGRDQIGHFVNDGTADGFNGSGVHFNLGGRSIYWSGLIPRMQEWELATGWPTAIRDYLLVGSDGTSGYDRAEILMRKQTTLGPYQQRVVQHLNTELAGLFSASDLPRSMHQPDFDSYLRLQNVIQRSTGGYSTADLLLDSIGFSDAAGRNNLRINLHHLVKRIETSGDTATAVICQDMIGQTERRYTAKYIVMACGSLETPKLALNSELNDPNCLIGVGLTDHPAYFYTKLHQLPQTDALGWLGDPSGHAKVMLRHDPPSATHPYNIELLINAKYWDTRHADDDLWNHRIANGRPAEVEIKFIFNSPLVDTNSVKSQGEGQKAKIKIDLNQRGEAFKEEIVAVRNQILTTLGVTGLTAHYDGHEWSEGIHGSVHHAGGTMRISDDGTGVVDQNLKLEAYDNLYCCDVSVNPSIPAANPSLTLTALAIRLADTLKERLKGG